MYSHSRRQFLNHRILVRHVLSSLATGIAMVITLPKSVTNHMESLMRSFLWSAETTQSRRNQICWVVVCLSTKEGGLSIRRIHEQNEASSFRSLWTNWMTCRYFPKSAIWSSTTPKSGSCIWHRIRKLDHQSNSAVGASLAMGSLLTSSLILGLRMLLCFSISLFLLPS